MRSDFRLQSTSDDIGCEQWWVAYTGELTA